MVKAKKRKSHLATQIRISYIVLLLPSLVFIAYAFYNLWVTNQMAYESGLGVRHMRSLVLNAIDDMIFESPFEQSYNI